MARTSKLNDKQKDRVVELIQSGKSRKSVATFFNVSPRTIYRVLYEKGVQPDARETVTTVPQAHRPTTLFTQEETEILRICKAAGLDADGLRRTLATPALTPDNIRSTLASLGSDQLGMFLDTVYGQRALQTLRTAQATKPEQQEMPA